MSVALDLGAGAVARADGDATGFTGTLVGSAARWAAGATSILASDGAAALAGTLDGTFAWSPAADPLVSADVAWRDGAARVADANLTWGPDGVAWTLAGRRIGTHAATPSRREWRGSGAQLERLLATPPATVRADGALSYAATTGWSGSANGTLAPTARDDLSVDWRAIGDGALRVVADGRLGPATGRVDGSWSPSGVAEGTWEVLRDRTRLGFGHLAPRTRRTCVGWRHRRRRRERGPGRLAGLRRRRRVATGLPTSTWSRAAP